MSLLITRRVFGAGVAGAATQLLLPARYGFADTGYAVADKRIALVIANWKYQSVPCARGRSNCDLHSPLPNANAISAALRAIGYDVSVLHNGTLETLRRELASFSRLASVSSMAVMYYAGHGLQYNRQNYLVPVDANITTGFDIAQLCVPADWSFMEADRNDNLGIMMLDACRENPFLTAVRQNPDSNDPVRDGLAAMEAPNLFVVSYATAANALAKDTDGPDVSPYAKAILNQLADPSVTVETAFDRIITAVCDLTSGAPVAGVTDVPRCQRPELHSNLGAEPVYFGKSTRTPRTSSSPLLVNLKMADPQDPAVNRLLGKANSEFQFRYLWQEPDDRTPKAQIVPDLDYFTSAIGRDRPLIHAATMGFYDPEINGGTLWSLSYPILDLIGRNLSAGSVRIAGLVIEVAKSRLDNAPYVDLVAEDVGTGKLLLLNQSWQVIKKVKLDFDIIGQKQLTDDEATSWIETRTKGRFKYSLEAKDIQNNFSLDISPAVKGDFPAIVHYMFAGDKEISVDEHGTVTATKWSPRKKVPVTADFAEWYKSKPKDEVVAPLWIGGQMTSFGQEGGEITVDFVAPIPLQPPEVGAGGISYDLVDFIAVPIDGKAHTITKRIDMTLKNGKSTFRGLFPITAKQSSFHEIRVTLHGEGKRVLFQSSWADIHVVVSRTDKQAVLGKNWSKY